MSEQSRREAVERIFAAASNRGHPVDDDPYFRALVEEWIAERIDIDEVRAKYWEHRRKLAAERRGERAAAIASLFTTPKTAEASPVGLEKPEEVPVASPVEVGKKEQTLADILNEFGWTPEEDER